MTSPRLALTIFLCALLLSACDGAGGPVPLPNDGAAPGPATVSVTGRATKGPVAGAQIELFAIDARGRATGAAVASAITDAGGNWTAAVPADHAGLLVRSAGGVFVDEADPDPEDPRSIALAADEALISYLPPGAALASITLVSDALVRKAQLETDADNFAERLASNRARYDAVLGLDPLVTASADPLAPVGSAPEQRYALIVGGLAYALNALAVDRGQVVADYATIELLLDDLLDCRLDGTGLGGQPLYDVGALGGRTLDDEILRFRNNHAAAFDGIELPQLDATGCPAAADALDLEPPVFVAQAAPLTLAAVDAEGASSESADFVAALAAFEVTDNRDDEVQISVDLPARFALGSTPLVLSARDAWGNEQRLTWTVTVSDLSPPVLEVPPDRRVDATGVRTPVLLGDAMATDNVSPGVVVTNDAPADGFVVGDTPVTWRAVDEAGLVSEAVQMVTVIGAVPVVSSTFAPPPASVGALVDIDLSRFFTDPFGAALVFTLAGLPDGTGFQFDPASGRLSGFPAGVDREASPLILTVTASNGQFEQSVSFELPVAPRVPDFALSTSQILVAEDFVSGPVIEIEPLVPIPPEILTVNATVDPPLANVTVSGEGAVQLTALPDSNGAATLTVTAQNVQTGEAASRAVSVNVAPVNDPPAAIAATVDLAVGTDTVVAIDANALFVDVDGDALNLSADGLPRALALSDDGLIAGVLDERDATAGGYDVVVTAHDVDNLSARSTLSLALFVPDADGDGLSDARELLLGTDPNNIDSDGDAVDDGTEVLANADPLAASRDVFFVSPNGDNANDGRAPERPLRDLDGLRDVPSGQGADRPTFVLFEYSDTVYGGSIAWSGDCDQIVLAGDIDPQRRVATGAVSATVFTNAGAPPMRFEQCGGLQVLRATWRGNTHGAVSVRGGSLELRDVAFVSNVSAEDGAGLQAENSLLGLRDVVASNNVSAGLGGAMAVAGGALDVHNAVFHDNRAGLAGGALKVTSARAQVRIANALFVGNRADTGAAVAATGSGAVVLTNTTASDNHVGFGGAAFDARDQASLTLRDSVLVSTFAPNGDGDHKNVGVDSTFSSLDRGPYGSNDTAVTPGSALFGATYRLRPVSAAEDTGSRPAVDAVLDSAFSLDGRAYPDEGTVDRGYHYSHRPLPLGNGLLVAVAAASDVVGQPDFESVVVTLTLDGATLGSGYRVHWREDAASGNGQVATDLGDGRYAAFVPVGTNLNSLEWWVDGQRAER